MKKDKDGMVPVDYIPSLDWLYQKTCEFVRDNQGEKGFIDTQDEKKDTIYAFVFDESEERGVEMEVVGVKEENDELFVKVVPVSSHEKIVFGDDDPKEEGDEHGWLSVKYSDIYYYTTIINIAESIHEYVLD